MFGARADVSARLGHRCSAPSPSRSFELHALASRSSALIHDFGVGGAANIKGESFRFQGHIKHAGTGEAIVPLRGHGTRLALETRGGRHGCSDMQSSVDNLASPCEQP